MSNKIEAEWDEDKNRRNKKKHKVSFEEAATVFNDPMALIVPDDEHTWGEKRYYIIGVSGLGDLLVVFYTERGNSVRIISARTPTRKERRDYEEGS